MQIPNWKKEIWSVPNLLSLFRLLLIPVYVVLYLNANSATDYYIAAAILAVSCTTDAIDGQIARHFNMITTLGKFLDPLADKLTQFTMIVCLAIRYPILWIMIGLFFVKESFQLIAGILMFRKGKMLKGAHIAGKICTTVLFLSLIGMVLFPTMDYTVVVVLTMIDCIALLVSFIFYANIYFSKQSILGDIAPEYHEE